jgi:RND family efflux transporter MFP subunit
MTTRNEVRPARNARWALGRPFSAALGSSLAAVLLLTACGSDEPMIEDAALIPVRVQQPSMRRALPPIVLTGTLGAKEEIPLAFKIGGVVTRVAVDAGAAVRAGQVLAEISQTEIDAQVAAAREGRDKTQRDLTRIRALYADSVATISQLEDAVTQAEVAAAQLRAAEFNRQYAVIRAPAAGIVLRRQLEPGQMVGANTTVFVLRSSRRGLVLRAAAADRDAVRIKVGERAVVTFDAFPGDQFGAEVERVAVAASPVTGTYEVELTMRPTPRTLVSGLVGRATLYPVSDTPLPFIPAEALLEADGVWASVFVLDADGTTVRRVPVRVAFLDGTMAAIAGGLADTSRVITSGATRLADGDSVRVVSSGAGAGVSDSAITPPLPDSTP